MKKNLFFTFCFSFIPGAGQMYQNYMKRGLSIMLLFASFIALTVIANTPIFAIPIPIIFAYSFFDTYNIRNKKEDDEEPKDEYIWETFGVKNKVSGFKTARKNSLLGTILILFGAYLICNNVLVNLFYQLELDFMADALNKLLRYIPVLIISILSIFVGLRFLTNKEEK
jgi:hypothetical protein